MVIIYTLFQTGSKTIPFGATHTYIAYIREYPQGGGGGGRGGGNYHCYSEKIHGGP